MWWETPAAHARNSLLRYGCTALAVCLYAVSMLPARRAATSEGGGASTAGGETAAKGSGKKKKR